MAKRTTAKKATAPTPRKSARKRELIDTGNSKRYVRRDDQWKFNEVDEQRALCLKIVVAKQKVRPS